MLILLESYASTVNLETLQQALLLISNILALSFLVFKKCYSSALL